jgi:6-phosphofructokinase 1
MKRIAVLTSGGDAPGMNAAIRAVVRAGIAYHWDVFGVQNGYAGLVAGDFRQLGLRDVGGIIARGGTFLGSARCLEFKTDAGRQQALQKMKEQRIEGLVVIGGNGSQTGSQVLSEMGVPVVGLASTIDNDLQGSDMTIGATTALDVALESIDRLKTTASSHRRAFLVEIMGRDCGYLALAAGIAGGAECVVIPETESPPEMVAKVVHEAYMRGKPHALVVVAEGARHNAHTIAQHFIDNKADLGFGVRTTTLGHVQRGAAPGAFDRLLASRLGVHAVDCLHRNETGVLVGLHGPSVGTTPLREVAGRTKPLDPELLRIAPILQA